MSDNATGLSVKQHLGKALRLMLKPLVKLFIDQGIPHSEFVDAVTESYVEMAMRSQPSLSSESMIRAAITTGLTREEVASVLEKALKEEPFRSTLASPRKLLHEWHNDSRYTGPYGIPSELPLRSDNGDFNDVSFETLVQTYIPDQNPEHLLVELLRVGAIVETEKNHYKVLRRDFEAEGLSPQLIERFGDVIYYLLKTTTFNVQKRKVGEGIFDSRVLSGTKLNQEELDRFSAYLKSRGHSFLEEVDNWLTNNVSPKSTEPKEKLYDAGLATVQYIVSDVEQKKPLRDYLIDNDFAVIPEEKQERE